MNQINPKKLMNSKWTAVAPINKEKHFLITDVELSEDSEVVACTIEAIMSKREMSMKWQTLKNEKHWIQGWK